MARFFIWVVAVALTIGFGPKLVTATLSMARAAVHAHKYDQMSYAKFTNKLLTAKPRPKPKQQEDTDLPE